MARGRRCRWGGSRTGLLFWLLASILPWSLHALDVDQLKPSVLRVITSMGSGSAFVVSSTDEGCFLATNAHVVDGMGTREVFLLRASTDQTKVEAYKAEIIWSNVHEDLAILKAPALKAEPLVLSNYPPKQVEEVYSFGFPGVADDEKAQRELFRIILQSFVAGLFSQVIDDPKVSATGLAEVSVSKGGVRRLVKGKWEARSPGPDFLIIEHDVNITSGNSGGPLLNQCAQVVGINTQRVFDPQMPVDVVRKSAHTSILITALRSKGLPFMEAKSPCSSPGSSVQPAATVTPVPIHGSTPSAAGTPAKPDPPAASSAPLGPERSSRSSAPPAGILLLVVVVLLLAAAAIGLAVVAIVRRPAVIRETYTQFIRRGGAANQPPLERSAGQPSPSLAHELRVQLDGLDPEAAPPGKLFIPLTLAPGAGKIFLGRKRSAVHFHLGNSSISGQHAAVWCDDQGRVWVEDRNSSNGTMVNGRHLAPFVATTLNNGDVLRLGDVALTLKVAYSSDAHKLQ